MKRLEFLYSLLFIVMFIAVACSEGSDCYSDNTSIITIDFFKRNYGSSGAAFSKDVLVVNRVYAIGNEDSLIVENDTIFGTLVLPVNPLNDTTTYRIGRHTLTVKYDIHQRIMSPDCGVEQVFSSLDTLTSSFDSLVIKSRNLDKHEVNFEIYSR